MRRDAPPSPPARTGDAARRQKIDATRRGSGGITHSCWAPWCSGRRVRTAAASRSRTTWPAGGTGGRTGGRLVTGGGRVEGQAIKAMHVGCRRSDGGLWRRVNGRTEQDGESVLQQSPWLSLQRMDGWMDGWRRCLARDSQKPAARTWTKRSLGLTLFTLCLLARPGRPVG